MAGLRDKVYQLDPQISTSKLKKNIADEENQIILIPTFLGYSIRLYLIKKSPLNPLRTVPGAALKPQTLLSSGNREAELPPDL
ncbi:Insulin Receptor-Related Protein [Manis pentadactyla]|nr:Insulin Receptor-Related Protein [Manis pentadactyla]